MNPPAIPDKRVPAWQQLAAKFWAPVPWMLEAVIVLQILLGRGMEALVIVLLLVFSAVIAFVQEQRAKDALTLRETPGGGLTVELVLPLA